MKTGAPATDGQAADSALPDYGGALYSPFSTTTAATEGSADTHMRVLQRRQEEPEADFAATAVAAVTAAGFVLALVLAWIMS